MENNLFLFLSLIIVGITSDIIIFDADFNVSCEFRCKDPHVNSEIYHYYCDNATVPLEDPTLS